MLVAKKLFHTLFHFISMQESVSDSFCYIFELSEMFSYQYRLENILRHDNLGYMGEDMSM